MDKKGNDLTGGTVTSGDSSRAYSAHELAAMKLPRYPTTPKGWYAVIKKQPGWRTLHEPGKGPGGVRQVFVPPPDVMALIEARQHGAQPEAKHVIKEPLTHYGPVKADLLQPSAEWLFLAVSAVNEAAWLPGSVKADKKAQSVLVIRLFNLLVLHIGSDDARWQWMLDHPNAMQNALRFVYDLGLLDDSIMHKPE
jgi:hypothetical protein